MPIGDWRTIGYYLGKVLVLLAATMMVPLTASIILLEKPMFTILILLDAIMIGLIGYLLIRHGSESELSMVDSMILTALTFTIGGIAAGIPIIVYDTPANAFFEGISAITTTGLSALNPQALTPGVQFLRAYYQWVGGLGIALMLVSFLVTPGTTAYTIYAAHLGEKKIKPLSSSTFRTILKIYLALTLVYLAIYLMVGFDPFTSTVNSMTTVSTGGFSTIPSFKKPVQQAATTILMYTSAQPLILYYYLYKKMTGKILRESQLISFTLVIATSILLLTLAEGVSPLIAAFQSVSALSTTGYTAVDNRALSSFGKLLLSILMIIGAGYGSTGGGLKQMRIIILFKHIYANLKAKLLPPNTIINITLDGRKISREDITQAHTLLLIYILVLLASTLAFTAYKYPLADSLFETSSALATTGLSTGLSGPHLPVILKTILMIDMLMGRVEIIPFIYMLTVPVVKHS